MIVFHRVEDYTGCAELPPARQHFSTSGGSAPDVVGQLWSRPAKSRSRPQAGIRGGRVSSLTHWHGCKSMPSKSAGIITQTTAMVPACSAPAQSLMPSITPSATSPARRRAPAAQTQLGGAATAHLNRRGVALARRRLRAFPGHSTIGFGECVLATCVFS